jgi:hypothetical protein
MSASAGAFAGVFMKPRTFFCLTAIAALGAAGLARAA